MKPGHILALTLTTAFFYLPIAVLGIFSFNASKLMAFPLSGFTLDWYGELSRNSAFLGGFVTSFWVSQIVGLFGAGFGLMAGLALTSSKMRMKAAFLGLILIPFLVPKTVLSIAQAMLLNWIGIQRGPVALIFAETLVAIPFATIIIAAVLIRLDPRLIEAARDLGATPWQSFTRVTWPQIKPAVGAAYSISVVLSLADLIISMYLAGRTQPLSLIVASAFRRELSPDLNAMQMVVLALTIAIVALTETYRRVRGAR